jgi:hypothetical protein
MSAYWFKPKERGYGNVPATWQGWLLTVGFTLFVPAMAIATSFEVLSRFWCVVTILAVTAVFLVLLKAKTDGEWRWR